MSNKQQAIHQEIRHCFPSKPQECSQAPRRVMSSRPKSFSWFMNLYPLESSLNTSINIEKSGVLKSRKARLRISTERGVHQVDESARSTQSG
ncbi:hypothetical protein TIFTF001_043297 [Ficus carica]|uniref:Uncharacterized protein n=1 Tax=Ficus carica TaxID=3494 RepID=A0AA88CLM8_FICCA|nr:hypothetical protein TIFTF001_043297 [Ficus carica]